MGYNVMPRGMRYGNCLATIIFPYIKFSGHVMGPKPCVTETNALNLIRVATYAGACHFYGKANSSKTLKTN